MTDDSTWRNRPFAPAAGSPLCAVADVPTDNGREFVYGTGQRVFRLVLFRVEVPAGGDASAGVRAFVNECPHAGTPLQYNEQDVFCVYDIDGRRDLLCPHHSAMFHLDNGHCYDGPCAGDRLTPVEVVIEQGTVRVG